MEQFKKLGINEELLRSISEHEFDAPTEIQEKSIPFVLAGKDVIAGASTGSGKTLAFAAAVIQSCERKKEIQALVLTPTRELAEQVADSIKMFSRYHPLEISKIYGGVSINPQINELRRADVVVGTPGRILDHIERRTIDLQNVRVLVLDEADRMLDMGFIRDVEKIMERCPKHRQTLLFSATISQDISRIAKKYMKHDSVEVSAESYVDPSKLKQFYYDVDDNMKFALLVHLLKKEHAGLVMVFCNTQRNTDFVAHNLNNNGINALAIHGGLSQDRRSKIIHQFHEKDVMVLVCTDVAARGLDIQGVSHVYNYDSPNEYSQYVHRIGRTARAGENGMAINIIASRDYENFANVRKHYREFNIERIDTPEVQRVEIQVADRGRGRGGGGRGFGRGGRSFGGGFGGRRSFGGGRNFREHDRRDGRKTFGNRSRGRMSRFSRGGGKRFGRRDSSSMRGPETENRSRGRFFRG